MSPTQVKQIQVETGLARWHDCVKSRDLDDLKSLIHQDAVFRSPMAHTPYPGQAAMIFALSNVLEVFEDFTYHREFVQGDSAALEFSAGVDGKTVKGVDLIKFDQDGLIIEFEVMVRPMSGLKALGQQMAPRMQDGLAALTASSQQ